MSLRASTSYDSSSKEEGSSFTEELSASDDDVLIDVSGLSDVVDIASSEGENTDELNNERQSKVQESEYSGYAMFKSQNQSLCETSSDISSHDVGKSAELLAASDEILNVSGKLSYKNFIEKLVSSYDSSIPFGDGTKVVTAEEESLSYFGNEISVDCDKKMDSSSSEEKISPPSLIDLFSTDREKRSNSPKVRRIDADEKDPAVPEVRNLVGAFGLSLSPHICELCGTSFSTREEVISHIAMKKCITERVHICPVCDEKYPRRKLLIMHRKNTGHDKPYQCDDCKRCFKYPCRLKAHKLKALDPERSHVCKKLSNEFHRDGKFCSHSQFNSQDHSYFCDECGLSSIEINRAKLQKKKKSGKRFTCQECGNSFAQYGTLKNHIRTHTKEKPHICEYCGKGFSQVATMVNHKRTHTGEKPFQCKECGKSFSQHSTLKEHLKTHSGERPYECPECKKRFSQLATLKNHTRTHLKKKPFSCTKCDREFAQKSTLNKHMVTHTNEKQFICKHCGKKFAQAGTLSNHLKTHERDKLYERVDCGESHTLPVEYRLHQNSHGKTEVSVNSFNSSQYIAHREDSISAGCTENVNGVSYHGETDFETPEAKPYGCGVCGSCFSTINDLETHVEVH